MNCPHISSRGLRLAVLAAETGTVLLAAAAFVLSFTALHDLAARSGIDRDLAWLWPLIVDGIIVVATVAVFTLAGTRVIWYPWLLLILGAGVSVAANAVHALVAADPEVSGLLAGSVASVPPIVLVASTHLTAILIRHSRTVLQVAAHHESVAAEAAQADAQLRAVETHQPAPDPEIDVEAPLAEVNAEERRTVASTLRGLGLNNSQIARLFGVDRSTVGRWLLKPVEEQETPS
ncbi:DUF2637 domain-containing protein [Leucobacter sp. cx-328]|uniref:DUF2637 domain-containing protein n=2 Tax=Micrococcales TaxID=85006 RepID=A0A3P3VUI1_9MICO|nr:DUF2637 domain-containing protein [Leucobacter sp. cx-328]MBL5974509.1 DUF2637 domain-containing protein [Candidatus Leucobacter sulfamidivorax]RRJ85648.1 DUF2637 domain-containing protein [Gulosibacter macacae]